MRAYLIITDSRDQYKGFVYSVHRDYALAVKAQSRVSNKLYHGQRTVISEQWIHCPKQSSVEFNPILGMWSVMQ